MEIVIQSLLASLNDNTLDELRNDISREFEHIRVRITSVAQKISNISLKGDSSFNTNFNSDRNQWDSPKLLEWFHKNFKTNKDRIILLILDIDAYSNGLNFVLGEACPYAGL